MMLKKKPNRSSLYLNAKIWVLLACLAGAGLTQAQNIVFQLKNGDRITGAIVSETASEVVVNTAVAGQIRLQPAQIQSRAAVPAPVQAPVAAPAPSQPAPAPAVAKPPAPAPKPAPIAAPEPPKKTNEYSFKKFLSEWDGDAQIGLNMGFGSTDRQTFTGRAKATHTHNVRLKNILTYDLTYGSSEGLLTDNRMDGSWKLEYDIKKRFLVYNSLGAGYDEIRKIDLRFDLGPGVGYKLIMMTNFVLKTELGGNYQEQFYADDTKTSRYSLRVAEDATWQINKRMKLDEKIEFFPDMGEFSEFRVRLELNFSYLIADNLTLSVNVTDLYDTRTPPGVSNNDLQIRSLIGVKF